MSSEARTFQRRATRKRKMNAATRRPRTSVRGSRVPTKLPHPRVGWYAGVTAMAIIEIIEWPLAIVMIVGHEIAHRAHSQALRDFADGVEAGMTRTGCNRRGGGGILVLGSGAGGKLLAWHLARAGRRTAVGAPLNRWLLSQRQLHAEQERDLECEGRLAGAPRRRVRRHDRACCDRHGDGA